MDHLISPLSIRHTAIWLCRRAGFGATASALKVGGKPAITYQRQSEYFSSARPGLGWRLRSRSARGGEGVGMRVGNVRQVGALAISRPDWRFLDERAAFACVVAAAALTGCGKIDGAGSAAVAPARRAGLWEEVLTRDGKPGRLGVISMCVDAATDHVVGVFGRHVGAGDCERTVLCTRSDRHVSLHLGVHPQQRDSGEVDRVWRPAISVLGLQGPQRGRRQRRADPSSWTANT